MHLKKINELAVILEKVNYLYRNIRKSNDAPKKIELALLKRYVTDFYDGLLELDVPAGTFSASTAEHQATTEASSQKTLSNVAEKLPVAALVETPNTSEEEKEAPWVATMSEKFTSIKESIAEKVETAKESVSEKVSEIKEDMPSWKDKAADLLEAAKDRAADLKDSVSEKIASLKESADDKADDATEHLLSWKDKAADLLEAAKDKAADLKDSVSEKIASLKESADDKADDATEHLPSWKDKAADLLEAAKDKAADLKDSVSEKIGNLSNNQKDNDDTDKPPVFERIKDSMSHEYREENDDSVRTMILENKGGNDNLLKITENTDDETVAIDAKKATPLIDALKGGKTSEGGGKNIFPINFNQRYAFVNRLFDGDEAGYGKAINDLSESKGYIEALTYVNLNLRYDYKWRDDDPTVKEFLDIIKHTFLD